MRAVGLKILKNELSEYVGLAARDETVPRPTVIASLQSWAPRARVAVRYLADARLAELVREGVITDRRQHVGYSRTTPSRTSSSIPSAE